MKLPIVVWSQESVAGGLRVVLATRGPVRGASAENPNDAVAVVERAKSVDAMGLPTWERVEPAEQGTVGVALAGVAWALAEYVGGNPS